MSSNEILLNMDNYDNFTTSELVGSLIELSRRDRDNEFDWNEHPISAKCLAQLKTR